MKSIGIDVGGSKILAIVADSKGRIHKSIKVPTPASKGKKKVLRTISDLVHAVKGKNKVSGIGIGVPGFVERNGKIRKLTNISGFRNASLKKELSSFRIPVYVENDVNCMVLGEKKFGALKKSVNGLCVTVGTGIGGGLLLNGKLYRGSNGFAGEIGHIVVEPNGWKCGCGKKGCLEAMVNKKSVKKRAREAGLGNISPREVQRLAEKGNKKAEKVYKETAYYLAIGLDNAVQMLDIDTIVLAGGISNSMTLVRETRKHLRRLSASGAKTRLVKSYLGENTVALGASLLPFQNQ